MKNQKLLITLTLSFAGILLSRSQNLKTGVQEGEYYVVTDTVDGKVSKFYYNSEKAFLRSETKRLERIDELKEDRRLYESNQRTELAEKIEKINQRQEQNDAYTAAMASRDKELTAQTYADKIDAYNKLIEAKLKFESTELNYASLGSDGVKLLNNTAMEFEIGKNTNKYKKQIKTTSGLSLGFGYNFIDGNDLGIDDFSYGNNNYFSLGITWITALNKSQTIRWRYGVEYQTQGTELNGNRAFTIDDPDNTQIERLTFNADKAKFRQDQFVFPMHLEFGPRYKKTYEDGRERYYNYDQLKFGIGGYAGFNLSSRLKYKYDLAGADIKQTTINAFDNQVLVYGVDAYVGFDSWSLFGRLGLNDIFQSGSVDGQYVAFGIRLQTD
ncbi:hypothetical protein [Nonlabens ponticola]|uniref:PorT family protein n=1 Tax=Nonlabens ponticola TaxID=2496866 RepID=A0A3S9N129_9FLAO|nr:hypothetical protein [Nonlabens ponticola]AZQ42707.1 hypothetical protein EJ995_00050 [Nonlabens ponticola]AZQ45098.1 hypothetical protein EJ995_12970 [Nonlabens ponticola]